MEGFIGQKVLMTTDRWFYGSDGRQYRAIWGTLKAVHEASKTLGFVPNRSHANWYYEIGGMIVMGCQGLYITICPTKPNTDIVNDYKVTDSGEVKEFKIPSSIYISE